jgi:hypothetical protein
MVKELFWTFLLGVFFLVLGNLSLIARHVELRRPFSAHNRQSLLRRALETPIIHLAVLILSLHVQHILHIQLEQICAARPHHTRSFVHLKTPASSVANNEVVDVVIGVWIASLQCENWCVWRSVQLDHGLHGQGSVDEVGWLIVHIFHMDYDPLIVSV